MSKKTAKKKAVSLSFITSLFGRRSREFIGIILIAFAIFSFTGLVSYNPGDPSVSKDIFSSKQVSAKNSAGVVGAYISDVLITLSGSAAFIFPFIILILAWGLIRGSKFIGFPFYLTGGILLFVALCSFLNLVSSQDYYFGEQGIKSGGILGNFVSSNLTRFLNRVGSYIAVFTLFFLSVLTITRVSLGSTVDLIKDLFSFLFKISCVVMNFLKNLYSRYQTWREISRAHQERVKKQKATPKIVKEANHIDATLKVKNKDSKAGKAEKFDVQDRFEFYNQVGGYHLPAISLLDNPPTKEAPTKKSENDLILNSTILEKKLLDFGIEGKIVQVLPGPVITMYEFEPASGVKVSKIVSLSDDLAMGMRSIGIRILAPVPGKAVVGIEVPNLKREFVYLKEILAAEEFDKSKKKLLMGLGKDISGLPVITNLAQIPHLLVAGSTGSGKSVGINAMILSILFKANPDEVKFIMIDPKVLELSVYDGIPHLIAPVVTNPKKAATALRWAVEEMEKRYQLMSEKGVKNIDGYNRCIEEEKKAQKSNKSKGTEKGEDQEGEREKPLEKIPFIVIVIDELADLMMVASKDVEECLTRLAQMARAAGIHLLVATQRPSVDVLTGIIKANFPARISFQVISKFDARTILDTVGSEKLLGKGDMLFLPPGTSRLSRIHGAMVTDVEIKRVVEFLKKQQKPIFLTDIFKVKAEIEENESDEEYDEKYDEAIALVTRTGQASISMIQRKLKVGYNRAARMVEIMEKEGVVGPSDGIKPRNVYAKSM
ncbi:MAG TPA: DNA translocase FtsK 4TM domain-containing protein [Nitrospinota bacterium]|nr:DNA translocase FtsK 4TM domain-containing protein [Nitrospinota bacterium]